jgi:hypothetical protein
MHITCHLVKASLSILRAHVEMFDLVFGIQGPTDGTEDNPAVLPQVTIEEWVFFYEFLTRRCVFSPPKHENFLTKLTAT